MRKVIFPLFVLTVCTVHMAWADDSASAMTNDTTSNNTTQSDTSTLSVPNNQQAGMAGNEATPGVSTAQSSGSSPRSVPSTLGTPAALLATAP
jgi:hypothetical protein